MELFSGVFYLFTLHPDCLSIQLRSPLYKCCIAAMLLNCSVQKSWRPQGLSRIKILRFRL